jgi:hypothetical protein
LACIKSDSFTLMKGLPSIMNEYFYFPLRHNDMFYNAMLMRWR